MINKIRLILLILLCFIFHLDGLDFSLPATQQKFIGNWHFVKVQPGDTLSKIALDNDVSLLELLKHNLAFQLNKPIHPGQTLLIPNCYSLPELHQNEIIVNLANQMLYYRPADDTRSILIYPVTIGKPQHPTPQGDYYIKRKKIDPIWYPPASIRAVHAKQGKKYPFAVGPGPHNPLGKYAMYLNKPTYLIHTAINATALGGAQSFGCIRMYKRDIAILYPKIKINTAVKIINVPIANHDEFQNYCTRLISAKNIMVKGQAK